MNFKELRVKRYGLYLLALLSWSATATAKVSLVTTTTDLAWAAKKIGGDHVEVTSFLDGTENAHHVDAVPAFILQAANADVVCLVGLDLEIGWLPPVLARSGNAQVQPGGKGYCELGNHIESLERPVGSTDRSMGDVHPAGNPHFWLAPSYLAKGAAAIRDALIRVDSKARAHYQTNYTALETQLIAFERAQKAKFERKKPKLVQYHTDFTYFMQVYSLDSVVSIEEKPGVLPSAGRLGQVAILAKSNRADLVIALTTDPSSTLSKFTELSGIPHLQLAGSLLHTPDMDYIKHHENLVDQILKRVARD